MRTLLGILAGIALGVITNLVSNMLAPASQSRPKLVWSAFIALVGASIAIALLPEFSTTNSSHNTAIVEVVKEAFYKTTLVSTSCTVDSRSEPYQVNMYISDQFVLANNGTKAVSLIDIRIKNGRQVFAATTHQPLAQQVVGYVIPNNAPYLELPLIIEPGGALKILVEGKHVLGFASTELARESIGTYPLREPNVASFELEFSDKSLLKHDKEIVSYSTQPGLPFNVDCKELP